MKTIHWNKRVFFVKRNESYMQMCKLAPCIVSNV